MKNREISVVGAGYVGTVMSACLADAGYRVLNVDKSEEKVSSLSGGEVPFYEPGLERLLKSGIERGALSFSTSLEEAARRSPLVFVAVGTPGDDAGNLNLSDLLECVGRVGELAAPGTAVVVKSTLPIGGSERVVAALASAAVGRGLGEDAFPYAVCPEFLSEGNAVDDFTHAARTVIGTRSEALAATLTEMFSPLSGETLVVTPVEAETIKLASNAYLATRLSFVNAMAVLCGAVGADAGVVSRGVGLDPRIGTDYFRPGIGWGGNCLPKDVRGLISTMRELGVDASLLEATWSTNAALPSVVVETLRRRLGPLSGKRVGVWGVTFKEDTDDTRCSQALLVLEALRAEGCDLRLYDPLLDRVSLDGAVEAKLCADPYDASEGRDVLVVLTSWEEFAEADLAAVAGRMRTPLVLDGRNVIETERAREAGVELLTLGWRPPL